MDTSPKDEILAAHRIVVGRSTRHFTLEAVAREAGISKGGLQHY
jgi:AcrR family transcriptional regulator